MISHPASPMSAGAARTPPRLDVSGVVFKKHGPFGGQRASPSRAGPERGVPLRPAPASRGASCPRCPRRVCRVHPSSLQLCSQGDTASLRRPSLGGAVPPPRGCPGPCPPGGRGWRRGGAGEGSPGSGGPARPTRGRRG